MGARAPTCQYCGAGEVLSDCPNFFVLIIVQISALAKEGSVIEIEVEAEA